jgi:putative hydrolase of the HAD superfamily
MMKYLYPEFPWEEIKIIGFDMDGTLYDEFVFIGQVYQPIARLFARNAQEDTYAFMLQRWIEKGSSYPHIFSEALERLNIPQEAREPLIKQALGIFRNFAPVLHLSPRVSYFLEHCSKQYELFLLSDGSSTLQWNKFNALQLHRFFKKENVFISGDHGKNSGKPGLASLTGLPLLAACADPKEVLYIGDRQVDLEYAQNAGFHFANVKPIFANSHL